MRRSRLTKILFVCHGNICRSYMAQCILSELVRRTGQEGHYLIDSAATSSEEIGNTAHPGALRKLKEMGITCLSHRARRFQAQEYESWDYIVYMDEENYWGLQQIHPQDPNHAYHKLLAFADGQTEATAPDVADPWYTGDFDAAWDDIYAGCVGLFERLEP
jgi:protein-tyrosine phosphatase